MLECCTLPIKQAPGSAVVFLHGLGDEGRSWLGFFRSLASQLPGTLFTFPNAPVRPVTINFGHTMPSWYDIASLDNTGESKRNQDRAGMHESSLEVGKIIDGLKARGIPQSKIFLGGFSQGGVVSLYSVLDRPEYRTLGGLVLLSCYLPLSTTKFAPSNHPCADIPIPVFWGHGDADTVIPHHWAVDSVKQLRQLGLGNLTFKTYPGMGHATCPDEENNVHQFIKDLI